MNRWLKAVGVMAAASLLATGCMNRARTEEGTGGSGEAGDRESRDEGINASPDDGMGGAGQDPPTWDQEGTGGSGQEEESMPPVEEVPPDEDMGTGGAGTEEETTVPLPEDDLGTGGSGTIDEEGAVEPGPDDTLDDPAQEEMPPIPDEDSDY